MSDLDDLFARIDEDPTIPKPGDIEKLIEYYRKLRASKEAGTYRKARKEEGPKRVINLEELGLKKSAPPDGFKRRI